jgi:hypothetical protein
MVYDLIRPRPVRMRGLKDLPEDLKMLRAGILDLKSFFAGYAKRTDPVQLEHRNEAGKLLGIRRTHNTRTADGSNYHASLMSAYPFLMQSGQGTVQTIPGFSQYTPSTNVAITAPTSTTAGKITDTNGSITASTAALNQVNGFNILYGTGANSPMLAHCVGNSASGSSSVIWYFDNWLNPNNPGAAVTAPAANLAYVILPASPSYYMSLSTDTAAPAVLDHLMAGELGNGNFSGQTATFTRFLCTIANDTHAIATTATGAFVYVNTFTAAGSITAIQKCGMFTGSTFPNDAAGDLANVGKGGGILCFENTFSSVNMATNDTLKVSWTVNY